MIFVDVCKVLANIGPSSLENENEKGAWDLGWNGNGMLRRRVPGSSGLRDIHFG